MNKRHDADSESTWSKIETLFHGALRLPPEERQTYLDEAASGLPEIRCQVEAMLDADAGSGELGAIIDREAATLEGALEDPLIGKRLGPYEVFRRLGQGGMGAVYLAGRVDQEFRQQVTIKLIKPGMDSESILRRFRNERQILAGLDHPNIARLFDGGTTDNGQPYFVMEYIKGLPLDRYCADHRLSIAGRLELFLKICAAVQTAHQNLVVHRDLKPANLLVTTEGEPKLLDFGVAKLLNPELAAQTVAPTEIDQARLMTPSYASPEQVRGGVITTATDIYSLGVVLYELLTGRKPYRIKSQTPAEIKSAVCDSEPIKPSLRIDDRFEGGQPSAVRGRVDFGGKPDAWRRQIAGDLDNIILKAMHKEPRRRYQTVEQFAADIRRHQRGLPVMARPDSLGYRTSKFVRRNKLLVAFVALLLVFSIAMSVLSARVVRERDVARSERLRAEEVVDFLIDLFRVSDRRHTQGKEITARELLDKGVEEIEVRLRDQPRDLAKILRTMGVAYLGIGLTEPAGELIDRSLDLRRGLDPGNDLEVADSLHAKAQVHMELDEFAETEALVSEALKIRRRHLPELHRDVARSLNLLAEVLVGQGQLTKAVPIHQQALAIRRELLGSEHLETLDSLDNLAILLQSKQDYANAEPLFLESMEISRRLWGEDHAVVANSMNNLSLFLLSQGDRAGAEEWIQKSLEMNRRLLGNDHPSVAGVLNNYGRMLFFDGNYLGAAEYYRQALELLDQEATNNGAAIITMGLGSAHRELGDFAAAEQIFLEALEIARDGVGEDHWTYAYGLIGLSKTLHLRGDSEDAIRVAREAERIFRGGALSGHSYLPLSLTNLASSLLAVGEVEEAEALTVEALEVARQTLEEDHFRIIGAKGLLGACWSRQGRFQEAEPLLLQAYEASKDRLSLRSSSTKQALERLIDLYVSWGKNDAADEFRTLLSMATGNMATGNQSPPEHGSDEEAS